MKLFIALLCSPIFAFAQSLAVDPGDPSSEVFKPQGQLVSIQLIRGKPVRLFVVGREEAKLDLSDLKLSVRRLKPYPEKILKVDRSNNYFVISEPEDLKSPTDIEVTTRLRDKSEKLHFKIENKQP